MGQKLGSAWVSCPVVNDCGSGAFVSQGSVETRCAMQHDGLHDGGCWVFESGVDGPPMISERISHHFGALHLFESLFWQVHTISTVDLAGWISLSKHSLGGSNPGPSQDQDRLECGPNVTQTHSNTWPKFPTISDIFQQCLLCASMSLTILSWFELGTVNLTLSTWHCQLDTIFAQELTIRPKFQACWQDIQGLFFWPDMQFVERSGLRQSVLTWKAVCQEVD